MKLRLNKYLSQCGLGSRRKVEEFINSRRITLNGATVTELGTTVDTEKDSVRLDSKPLVPISHKYYLILNKPKGYITTTDDVHGRPTVMDLVPQKYKRQGVLPVGRLDKDTEGLLLLTNDGDLAHKLNHPNYKVTKEYYVEIERPLEDSDIKKIEDGIYLFQLGLKTRPAAVQFADNTRLHILITVQEGKKRQIRYTFKNLGYKVIKLKRTAYGPLKLGSVNRGSIRVLKSVETRMLKSMVTDR